MKYLQQILGARESVLRLKTASIRELAYRAKRGVDLRRLRGRIADRQILMPKAPLETAVDRIAIPLLEIDPDENVSRTLFEMYACDAHEKSRKLRHFENRNRSRFSADVDFKDRSVDIREVWETGRLQRISVLLHWSRRQEKDGIRQLAADLAKKELLRWIDENPFLHGPHYLSAMECGLRIPVFCYCLEFCQNLAENQRQLILLTLFRHTWWISKRLSLYASLGNHTICECIGLLFGGTVYRQGIQGRRWLEKALSLLSDELDHQILDDGGPVEQSLSYHRFVLDLYWLAFDFLKRNTIFNCDIWTDKLVRAERFLAAFETSPGRYPSIGDSDDGLAVGVGVVPKRLPAEKAQPGAIVFEHSGYTVIRSPAEVVFTFDHGPLGMPPLYNHGHADALSVTLSKNGRHLLVDPGTYRYNGADEFRKYFKGTRSHNTIVVDGKDQAVQATGFIWRNPFKSRIIHFSHNAQEMRIVADNDGYCRSREPVRHQRTVLYTDKANFIIEDRFFGRGNHSYEINFHLHSSAEASRDNRWWRIKRQDSVVHLKILGELDFDFVFGGTDPTLGWFSPAYGKLEKSGVLNSRRQGRPNEVRFTTVICTETRLSDSDISARLQSLDGIWFL